MYQSIKKEFVDNVIVIKLNRPSLYNAINMEMATELSNIITEVSNDSNIDGVIITGEGNAFCAGGDLKWISEQGNDYYSTFYKIVSQFHKAILEIHYMEKPVFAAINGMAAGGGFSLALACDFRIMEYHAQLILGYTSRGLSIDGGGTYSLPRIVGIAKALEIIAFDNPIDAQDALKLGLITEIVGKGESVKRSLELINQINKKVPPTSYSISKRLIYESFDNPLEVQLEKERRALAWVADQSYGREGIASFLEKREPVYKKN